MNFLSTHFMTTNIKFYPTVKKRMLIMKQEKFSVEVDKL